MNYPTYPQASMRPGQTAPEFRARRHRPVRANRGFNEAGADCPGILHRAYLDGLRLDLASMRPGQTAPEFEALTAAEKKKYRPLQ